LRYLLDTCVISELINPHQNEKIVKWLQGKKENDLFISVLTIGEVRRGIARLANSKKKTTLVDWVENDLRKRFAGRIVAITEDIANKWGELQAEAEKRGQKMPVIDSLIVSDQ